MGYKKLDEERPPATAPMSASSAAAAGGGGGAFSPATVTGFPAMPAGYTAAPQVYATMAGARAMYMTAPTSTIITTAATGPVAAASAFLAAGGSAGISFNCVSCRRLIISTAGSGQCICGRSYTTSAPRVYTLPTFTTAAIAMPQATNRGQCYSCHNLMTFPANSPAVMCPTCRATNRFDSPAAAAPAVAPQTVQCSNCNTTLQYPAGAPLVSCPYCRTCTSTSAPAAAQNDPPPTAVALDDINVGNLPCGQPEFDYEYPSKGGK